MVKRKKDKVEVRYGTVVEAAAYQVEEHMLTCLMVVLCGLPLFLNLTSCYRPIFESRPALADLVKAEFLHSWNAYKRYAWGHDALKPLSKQPRRKHQSHQHIRCRCETRRVVVWRRGHGYGKSSRHDLRLA